MRKIGFSKHNAYASKVFITGILKSFQFTNLPATYVHFIQIFRISINTTRMRPTSAYIDTCNCIVMNIEQTTLFII